MIRQLRKKFVIKKWEADFEEISTIKYDCIELIWLNDTTDFELYCYSKQNILVGIIYLD